MPIRLIFLLVAFNIVAGLALEAFGSLHGWTWAEPAVGVLTFLHLGFYFWKTPKIGEIQLTRTMIAVCLALATFGELVLSAMWGLYDYRQSILPAFVPPGHVLLFISGLAVVSDERCGNWVAHLVPLIAIMGLSYQLFRGLDVLSVPLFAIFLACLIWGAERRLYAVMFVLALSLELYGTALGVWVWKPLAPALGISSANPPLAAGVFYALLDMLVVKITFALASGPLPAFLPKHR